MELAAKSYKRHYGAQWTFLFLIGAAGIFWQWSRQHAQMPTWRPALTTTASVPRVNWFFIIKMPEISTQYESGVDTMKTRMTEWLTTMQEAGFHPMLLSGCPDAICKKARACRKTRSSRCSAPATAEPTKSSILFFPELHWPVLWLTDESAMQLSDRRLITYHTARGMKASGLYDIASDNGKGQFHVGSYSHLSWTSASGAFALNHMRRSAGHEFFSRHCRVAGSGAVESSAGGNALPRAHSMNLSKGLIQGREWGLTLPMDSSQLQLPSGF